MRRLWRGWRRIDPQLLCPVRHRSAKAQADLTVIRARAGLVRARTALVNTARGLAKSYGERLRGCNVRNMNPEKAEGLSPELQRALEPLLAGIESLSERIPEYNQRIESLAQESYPQVALLKQVKGVGTLIALTFLLTLEDPHRFRKSRDVGCYLGLQPGRRNSGQSEPQMHISKEGDPYLRTLLVQGAQHILGPFGPDCDLRRWGLKLAGARRKERKETSHHCHGAKAGRVAASPLGERRSLRTAAQQQAESACRRRHKTKRRSAKGKTKAQSRVSVTAFNRLAHFHQRMDERSIIRWQHRLKREHPTCTERTKSLNKSADGRVATVATRWEKNIVQRKNSKTHLTPTGLLMEGDYTQSPPPDHPPVLFQTQRQLSIRPAALIRSIFDSKRRLPVAGQTPIMLSLVFIAVVTTLAGFTIYGQDLRGQNRKGKKWGREKYKQLLALSERENSRSVVAAPPAEMSTLCVQLSHMR